MKSGKLFFLNTGIPDGIQGLLIQRELLLSRS